MKRIFLTLFCTAAVILGVATVTAQQNTGGTGSITGAMYVDADGDGEYDEGEEITAKIILLVLQDGKWVPMEASYTVENGRFIFEEVPFGTYRLRFEFEGGMTRTTQSFDLNAGNPEYEMTIPLSHDFRGGLVIPNTYFQGDESLGFVHLGALVGEEVSTFAP